MNNELEINFEEVADIIYDVSYNAVMEQKLHTRGFYKIELSDNKCAVIIIEKEKDKYKISIDAGENWGIVERNDTEATRVLLTIYNLLTQVAKIQYTLEKNNKSKYKQAIKTLGTNIKLL